jgi:hypothetical protein
LKFPTSLESKDNASSVSCSIYVSRERPQWVILLGKQQCFFFCGEISPNFDLQNMISTCTKDFSWKKNDPYSPDFEKIK